MAATPGLVEGPADATRSTSPDGSTVGSLRAGANGFRPAPACGEMFSSGRATSAVRNSFDAPDPIVLAREVSAAGDPTAMEEGFIPAGAGAADPISGDAPAPAAIDCADFAMAVAAGPDCGVLASS